MKPILDLGLKRCIISSPDNQLHVLDACLELRKAHLHGAADVKQDEGSLELLLHSDPLLRLEEENLAARQACGLINAVVDV